MLQFILIIKDTSDFGTVGLQGIHQVLETDRDAENIVYNVERDGFDRVFAYVKGWDDGTFDAFETLTLVRSLEHAGAKLQAGNLVRDIWSEINQALTLKQYARCHNCPYPTYFLRVLKASKRPKVQELAKRGFKYCHLFGWVV